jgi:hypothetical protein
MLGKPPDKPNIVRAALVDRAPVIPAPLDAVRVDDGEAALVDQFVHAEDLLQRTALHEPAMQCDHRRQSLAALGAGGGADDERTLAAAGLYAVVERLSRNRRGKDGQKAERQENGKTAWGAFFDHCRQSLISGAGYALHAYGAVAGNPAKVAVRLRRSRICGPLQARVRRGKTAATY